MNAQFVLERVAQPAAEPVTLAEMIQHLREFSSIAQAAQDELSALIAGAREWVEDYTGRALVEQSWRLTLRGPAGRGLTGDLVSGFSGPGVYGYGPYGFYSGLWTFGTQGEITLRKSPAIAITSFVMVDAAGTQTTVDPATYALREADSKWPRIVPLTGAAWSALTTSDIRITFRAGFAAGLGSPDPSPVLTQVPVRFKQAMKLWVEANYDRDEKTMQLYLDCAERLIKPERVELQIA